MKYILLTFGALVLLSCSKQSSYEVRSSTGTVPSSIPSSPSTITVPHPNEKPVQYNLIGIYSGQITMNDGHVTKLDVSLTEGETVIGPENPSFVQKLMGSFILEKEGGPYNFGSVLYDYSSDLIDFRYARSQNNLENPNLRLSGLRELNGRISGNVFSSVRGKIGTFELKKLKSGAPLTPQEVYTGLWKGQWHLNSGASFPITFTLSPSPVTAVNPPDSELEYTPGKIGSVNDLEMQTLLGFQTVQIDYLRNTFQMTSVQGGTLNAIITFSGKISGDTIKGITSSSLRGTTGTFEVRKVRN